MNQHDRETTYNPSIGERIGEAVVAFLIIAFMFGGQIVAPYIDALIIAGR